MIRQSKHFTSRIYNRRFAGQVLAIVDSYVAKPIELPSIPSLPSLPTIPMMDSEPTTESKGRRGTGDYKAFRERGTDYFQIPSLPKKDSNLPSYTKTNWYKKGWDAFVYTYYETGNMPELMWPGFRPVLP